jgi:hypothetical protein
MTRLCEICGAPIGAAAGTCQSCGVSHEALDEQTPITLGHPRWGIIRITFPLDVSENQSAIDALRVVWRALEENSFQKLAPSQLHLITAGKAAIELVGPYSTFGKLQREFENRMRIEFSDRSPAQIDELRANIPG